MNQRLVALHGFAGLPSDWAAFDASFNDWPLHKINLFATPPLPFSEWAAATADELASFKGRQVLLGYSLGGRLGAHLLLQAPRLFAGAVFVSTNPGLASEAERGERRRADAVWASKWASAPWIELQKEWNAQAVFQSPYSLKPARREADFDRKTLALAMQVWSLGEQADLRASLAKSPKAQAVPQLWLAGADDQKFVKLAREMDQISNHASFEAVPRAGHRAPWDNPPAFTASVASFLDSL